jgi:hypothetical protein
MEKLKLPDSDDIEELARFWDTHDATVFEDDIEEVSEPIFIRKPKDPDPERDKQLER